MNLESVETLGLSATSVRINEKFVITLEDIKDCEIHWDIEDVATSGYISFRDTLNFLEQIPLKTGNDLEIFFMDSSETPYKQNFIVKDIKYGTTDKGINMVSLDFIDKNSDEFLKIYEPKGFKEKSVQYIIADYYSRYSIYKDFEKQYMDTTKNDIFLHNDLDKTFIVPGDRTWYNTLNRFLSETELLFFYRRDVAILTNYKTLNSQKLVREKLPFKLSPPNQDYLFRIGDIKIIRSNSYVNNFTNTNITLNTYDISTGKKVLKKDYGFKNAVEDTASLGTTDTNNITTKSYNKQVYTLPYTMRDMSVQHKYANNAVNVVITVPGTFQHNIGDIVDLEIRSSFEREDIEKNMSGKYLITKIIDKVQANAFFQQLTLSRALNR